MLRDSLLDQLSGNNTRPNKFTIGMGKLIRAAREEMKYSQRDLAGLIYRRQAALSDMENGRMEPDASTLLLLSYCLHKPLLYFFPAPYKPEKIIEGLTWVEEEIIAQAKKLPYDDQVKIIAQIKALSEFDLSKENKR